MTFTNNDSLKVSSIVGILTMISLSVALILTFNGGVQAQSSQELEFGDEDIIYANLVIPSARSLKTGFSSVDDQSILSKVAGLQVEEWTYKSNPKTIRHIGPMAGEFNEVFGLGSKADHDSHAPGIPVVDAFGVSLSSIQALYERNKELEARVEKLEDQVQVLMEKLNSS